MNEKVALSRFSNVSMYLEFSSKKKTALESEILEFAEYTKIKKKEKKRRDDTTK